MIKKTNLDKIKYYYLSIALFLFLLLVYLSIPSIYKFDKLKPELQDKIYKEFGLKFKLNNKIHYTFFPSPRIKLNNIKIFNYDESKKILSKTNKVDILLDIFSLLGSDNLNFKKIIIKDSIFKSDYKNISLLKKFFLKIKLPIKKFKIINSEFFVYDNKTTIFKVDIINSKINFNRDLRFLFFDLKIFGTDVNLNFIYDDENIRKSKFYFNIPKLGLDFKTLFNTSKREIKGNTNVVFPNNKIKIDFILEEDKFDIIDSNIQLPFFKGSAKGKLNFEPFYFNLLFESDYFYIIKFLNNHIFKLNDVSKLLNINKKINGIIDFEIKNFLKKSKHKNSAKIKVEFKNEIINISNFDLIFEKFANIFINGTILEVNKKKYFTFKGTFDSLDEKKIYRSLLIPLSKRRYKLNFRFEAKYDFANNELIIEKLVNEKENYTEEQIRILNKQVQSYMYKKSLNEIFNILKLRIFINNLI